MNHIIHTCTHAGATREGLEYRCVEGCGVQAAGSCQRRRFPSHDYHMGA